MSDEPLGRLATDASPMDDDWEQRMARRAAERQQAERLVEDDDWVARLDRMGWSWVADMKLGEAVELLRWHRGNGPFACACIGPPGCCRYSVERAESLVRAAHIAAKLVAEWLSSRSPAPAGGAA
jgi:hypothetical protein